MALFLFNMAAVFFKINRLWFTFMYTKGEVEVLSLFQEVPQNLFTIFNAIAKTFLDVAQYVQPRISSLGTCTMYQLGCKTANAL